MCRPPLPDARYWTPITLRFWPSWSPQDLCLSCSKQISIVPQLLRKEEYHSHVIFLPPQPGSASLPDSARPCWSLIIGWAQALKRVVSRHFSWWMPRSSLLRWRRKFMASNTKILFFVNQEEGRGSRQRSHKGESPKVEEVEGGNNLVEIQISYMG